MSMALEMTPRQAVEQLETELGLSSDDLARALGTNVRTILRWRVGQTFPQHAARNRLAALLALHRRLRDTFTTSDAARTWLHSSSRYLGGLTPAEAIRVGRFDRVEAAMEALDSGVFV
jgi:hypothetical protein